MLGIMSITYRDRFVETDGPLRVPPVWMVIFEVLLDLLSGRRILFEMTERFREVCHQVHEAGRRGTLLCN